MVEKIDAVGLTQGIEPIILKSTFIPNHLSVMTKKQNMARTLLLICSVLIVGCLQPLDINSNGTNIIIGNWSWGNANYDTVGSYITYSMSGGTLALYPNGTYSSFSGGAARGLYVSMKTKYDTLKSSLGLDSIVTYSVPDTDYLYIDFTPTKDTGILKIDSPFVALITTRSTSIYEYWIKSDSLYFRSVERFKSYGASIIGTWLETKIRCTDIDTQPYIPSYPKNFTTDTTKWNIGISQIYQVVIIHYPDSRGNIIRREYNDTFDYIYSSSEGKLTFYKNGKKIIDQYISFFNNELIVGHTPIGVQGRVFTKE